MNTLTPQINSLTLGAFLCERLHSLSLSIQRIARDAEGEPYALLDTMLCIVELSHADAERGRMTWERLAQDKANLHALVSGTWRGDRMLVNMVGQRLDVVR